MRNRPIKLTVINKSRQSEKKGTKNANITHMHTIRHHIAYISHGNNNNSVPFLHMFFSRTALYPWIPFFRSRTYFAQNWRINFDQILSSSQGKISKLRKKLKENGKKPKKITKKICVQRIKYDLSFIRPFVKRPIYY